MNSIASLNSSINSVSILSFNPIDYTSPKRRCFRSTVRVTAESKSREADNSRNSNYSGGKVVDESMIVLRMRIHEMKTAEMNNAPPAHWMDWEKRCYASYDSHICEALGYLQSHLMNTRPSVALGMFALVVFSVPVSSAVVLFRLVEIAGALLTGIS